MLVLAQHLHQQKNTDMFVSAAVLWKSLQLSARYRQHSHVFTYVMLHADTRP